jgi:hypothetical protein
MGTIRYRCSVTSVDRPAFGEAMALSWSAFRAGRGSGNPSEVYNTTAGTAKRGSRVAWWVLRPCHMLIDRL